MNYELLKAHIEANTYNDSYPVLESDGSNVGLFYCADVVGARRFVLNYGGYPRSEIAEINEAQSLEMQMALLSSLNDFSPKDNPNSGLSDVEIMLGHKSKYIQTPSESVRWLESQIAERDAKRFAEVNKESDSSIKFDDADKIVDNV